MFSALLPKLISLTSVTGETIMSLQNESTDFTVKSDSTPLTQADNASHNLITDALENITPGIPIFLPFFSN